MSKKDMSSHQYITRIQPIYSLMLFLCLGLLSVMVLFPLEAGAQSVYGGATASTTVNEVVLHDRVVPVEPVAFKYIEVTSGCGQDFEGKCAVARSGPGGEFPVMFHLRKNAVLKVSGKIEHDGTTWYKIVFDEWLRYPERVKTDWFVGADMVSILDETRGEQNLFENGTSTTISSTSTKRIVVDISEQKLYAYESGQVFKEVLVSTGRMMASTPIGTFSIFKKTPSRYMQGPLPELLDQQVYDLPGVPWNLYFTGDGSVIHGTYWHDNFGTKYSHGCVNTPAEDAKELYDWAELGMKVVVRD